MPRRLKTVARKRRVLTPEVRDAMVRDYLAGAKVSVIATTYGVDDSYPGLLATRRGHASRWDDQTRRNMADATRARYARKESA